VLIGLAALFSTASAINATLFGTARLGAEMAREERLPAVFGFRRRQNDIPWASLLIITGVTLAFVNAADLTIISSFASSTFLLIFFAINLSAWRLRAEIAIAPFMPLMAMALSLVSWLVLMVWLWRQDIESLYWIMAFYGAVTVAELLFSQRRLWLRAAP